ncbi:hypothetical protein EV182_002030 [Spiromyces aspiralis]|uniref:Uncharacterized protein n=1 Tax=Spiromyces aspiralis TaxID=68401 RepID=A0ACC1HF14_9FUNG|nr:hypothetical protein EV182_002030 [Spiromyces aspiralis]
MGASARRTARPSCSLVLGFCCGSVVVLIMPLALEWSSCESAVKLRQRLEACCFGGLAVLSQLFGSRRGLHCQPALGGLHSRAYTGGDPPPLLARDIEPRTVAAMMSSFGKTTLKLVAVLIVNPLTLVVRTAYLLYLFVPVFLTYPIKWLGAPLDPNNPGGDTTTSLWWYAFLSRQMQFAGPAFIKLGQWAATRSDLFSREFCRELGKLHSQNREHSFGHTRKLVEAAMGGSMTLEELFEWFERKPLGTGAVAQVHRAKFRLNALEELLDKWAARAEQAMPRDEIDDILRRLRKDPQVAIKVLHPHVGQLIDCDLRIMKVCAWMFNCVPTLKWLSLPEEVELFSQLMMSQLDLTNEARNLHIFEQNFRDRPLTAFPKPITPLCVSEVLFETYESSISLKVLLSHPGNPYAKTIAGVGLDAFLHMIIYDNFIHADLHPGNILVSLCPPEPLFSHVDRILSHYLDQSQFESIKSFLAAISGVGERSRALPSSAEVHETIRSIMTKQDSDDELQAYINQLYLKGYTPRLVFLDCGLVTTLNPTDRRNFLDLLEAICTFQGLKAGQLMVERCRTPHMVRDPNVFALRIQDIILNVRDMSLKLSHLSLGNILGRTMAAVRRHHVKLEANFVNVVMATFVLEGIGRRLDPDLDLLKAALPILRAWWKDQAKLHVKYRTAAGGREAREGKEEPASGGGGGTVPQPQPSAADEGGMSDSEISLSHFELFKIWFYAEARQYIYHVRNWGMDDETFFGPFSPFISADAA